MSTFSQVEVPLRLTANTGGGKQGFQTPIANDSFLVDGVGSLGTAHTERGLTYLEVELSGHMFVFFLLLEFVN